MKESKKLSIKSMVTVGMFTAVLSVLSIIQIPMPSGVPITLQTFAVALCGLVLGWQLGTASVGIYILIGAVGVPVFSGMEGGVRILVGYTGGFIFGFLIMVFLCGLAARQKNKVMSGILCLTGLLACHLLGVLQFSFVTANTLMHSVWMVSVPFLVKDILSVAVAYVAAVGVRKSLRAASILE